MFIRKGNLNDINEVITLQNKYYLNNTPDNEKDQGFISTPFNHEQFKTIISFNGFFVAENDNKKIIAYLVVCSWDFFIQWPTFKYMASRFNTLIFNQQPVSTKNSFEYGPICIDKEYRNKGIAKELFNFMCNEFCTIYPIGITFINKLNKRSFNAHTNKLGLKVIDEFDFNGHSFYTLAFNTQKQSI